MTGSVIPARWPLRVPWTTVAGASAVAGIITVLMLVRPDFADSTLTIRLVQLALAAGAAYLLDDPAAELSTASPRSWWRLRAFSLTSGLLVIAVAWAVVLVDLRELPDPVLRTLTLELTVLVVLALAASAMLSRGGEPEPGNQVAVLLPLAGVGALLVGGMLGFDVFASSHSHDQAEKATAWIVIGGLALSLLMWASRDTPA